MKFTSGKLLDYNIIWDTNNILSDPSNTFHLRNSKN